MIELSAEANSMCCHCFGVDGSELVRYAIAALHNGMVCHVMRLDRIDLTILDHLQRDGRATAAAWWRVGRLGQ